MVTPGETEIEEPLPIKPTPQLEEYHCQLAPVPKMPPTAERVVELPAQIGFMDADAPVAAVEDELTVTVTLTQPVVLHGPSALT